MWLPNLQADFVEALIANDQKADLVTPARNISVYHHHVGLSLMKAMENAYPLIRKLLGDDFFHMTAQEYIRQYPSRSGNLYDYGNYFSDFLAEYQPVHDLIYLSEVAEFEWASHVIYLAAEHAPFDAAALAQYTQEQYENLYFRLHPAAWLHKFHFPMLEIIDLCHSEQQERIDLHGSGVNLLVIRRDLDISLHALSQEDFLFLQALNENETLSQALQAAHTVCADYPLAEKLPAFIQNKIIVDCYSED